MAALGWLLNLGFAGGGEAVVVEEITTYTGGWPSYGRRRKKRKRVEKVEEQLESARIDLEEIERKLAIERQERGRLEARIRLRKAEQDALNRLKDEIKADLKAIDEMQRVYDELLTLHYLEVESDRKRRKRNQLIVLMAE